MIPRADPFMKYGDWLTKVREQSLDRSGFLTRANSALDADDSAIGGALMSTTVQLQLHASVDSLRAALFMFANGSAHLVVPTLARAGFETAATALWLLAPTSSRERLGRLIRLKFQDAFDEFSFTGGRDGVEHEARRTRLRAAWDRVGPGGTPKLLRTAEIIEFAGDHVAVDTAGHWSLASGLAHGRPWAMEVASARTNVGATDRGTRITETVITDDVQVMMQMVVGDVLDHAFAAWNERSGNNGATAIDRLPVERVTAGSAAESIPRVSSLPTPED